MNMKKIKKRDYWVVVNENLDVVSDVMPRECWSLYVNAIKTREAIYKLWPHKIGRLKIKKFSISW